MLVQRNTKHGFRSSIEFVKFCLFFTQKTIFYVSKSDWSSNVVELGNLIY